METGLQEDLGMQPSQDAYNCLERIYGTSLAGFEISRKDSRLQTYGDVVTRQGRVLAFPNILYGLLWLVTSARKPSLDSSG
jgi:hypothetical protein